MSEPQPTTRRAVIHALVACALVGVPAVAQGRVGGGQRRSSSSSRSSSSRSSSSRSSSSRSSSSRSSPSRSSSSSSPARSSSSSRSSGGTSSGGGGGFFCLALPIFFAFFAFIRIADTHKLRRLKRVLNDPDHEPTIGPPALRFPDAVQEVDPLFSGALFIEAAQLAYTRIWAMLADPHRASMLATLIGDDAARTLRASVPGGQAVGLVTVGHTAVEVGLAADRNILHITFFANVTTAGGQVLDREERWTFLRPADAQSPPPERLRALACLACGSPLDPGPTGTCPACGAARTDGAPQWRVASVRVVSVGPVPDPELSLGGGEEAGLHAATVMHPMLRRRRDAFLGRNPGLDLDVEQQRLAQIFVQLQQAWSKGKWPEARPYLSDALFTANQAWLDQLAAQGLQNRTEDVQVRQLVLCDVETDAWVETLTVRIFASCLDWTERRRDQHVVGGSKSERRVFSEYWTFMRTIGARRKDSNPLHCPSCAAPLDRMGETGICGYCESKVSQGQFDWVATRIGQDEDAGR